MVIKRKRSAAELSSCSSSPISSFTSPNGVSALRNPFAALDLSPIHLHSRTLKRFRNSRPSEREVHQRTLDMLYSAQHQNTMDTTPVEPSHHNQPLQQQQARPETTQQSLHRFWNISSTPSAPMHMHTPCSSPTPASNCDDCGAGLLDGTTTNMMDQNTCGACGKYVCFSCSVSNLGQQRRCLQCAGRKATTAGGVVAWAIPTVAMF